MKSRFSAVLLAGTFLSAAPAFAATAAAQAAPSDTDARIQQLQDQIAALTKVVNDLKSQSAKEVPSWKGAPQFDDKAEGFSFKPKGLIQYDAGYTGFPRGDELRGTIAGGLNYANLGWNSRARRLTLGADGTLPGGFRYSAEFNFAQGSVDYEDIWLAYDVKHSPITLQAGNFYPFSSLETMTSSKFTSFLERASIHDAFNYNRRLGIALLANDKKNDLWTFQAGLFNEPINNTSFTRTGWQASVRGVFSPKLGAARLHLGANFQHRENTREALGQNYQSRPLTQLTDQRFISTGTIASKGDDVAGVEVAAILKSFHFAAEAQKVWVRHAYNAAELAALNTETDTNDTATGTPYNGNPSFWGGYAELGYYLTGEARGYKGGKWDRTKVLHPWSDGGWGAIQLNGRIDYVNLSNRVDGSSTSVAAPFYVNGGKQVAFQGSVIWNPVDWVRFMGQYGHLDVTGGPRASVSVAGPPVVIGMFPVGTTTAANKRKYGVDTFALRAQVDF